MNITTIFLLYWFYIYLFIYFKLFHFKLIYLFNAYIHNETFYNFLQEADMNHECGGCSYIKGLSISNLLLGLIILYYTQRYFHVWKDKNLFCLVELRLHQQYCLPCWLRHCCYIVINYMSVPTSLEVQHTMTFRELWIDICFCIKSMCDIIAVAQIDS